jgi:hypothetical protein
MSDICECLGGSTHGTADGKRRCDLCGKVVPSDDCDMGRGSREQSFAGDRPPPAGSAFFEGALLRLPPDAAGLVREAFLAMLDSIVRGEKVEVWAGNDLFKFNEEEDEG